MLAPEKSVALPGFFGEVRRRKVYRVAAAYIAQLEKKVADMETRHRNALRARAGRRW